MTPDRPVAAPRPRRPLLTAALALLAACGSTAHPDGPTAEAVLASLSQEEKAGQLFVSWSLSAREGNIKARNQLYTRVREVGPDIWTRTAARRPGMPEQDENKWDADLASLEDEAKPENRRFYAVYEEGDPSFQEKYFEMLRAGGSKHHKDLLAPFGLDASDPRFWDKGLGMISGFIDELEAMEV